MRDQSTRPATALQAERPTDRFVQIPNVLHDLVESPREYQFVVLLVSFRWYPSSPIIPSVRTLAQTLKCSERTVRRTAARLEDRGLIRREERRAADDRQMSNEYVLCGALLGAVTAVEANRDREERQAWQGRRTAVAGERYSRNYTNQSYRQRASTAAALLVTRQPGRLEARRAGG